MIQKPCNYRYFRIFPRGFPSQVNRKGVLYYQNLVKEILKYNITPVATIYHWDLPQPLSEIGGWTNPELVQYFVEYSRIVIGNLENVGYWITINEPKQICEYGYGRGTHAPGFKDDGSAVYRCAYVIVKAHAATYHMYKQDFPDYKGNCF